MGAGLDTGPMLKKRAIPIASDETGQSLHDKLAELGGELLLETLPDYISGELKAQAQAENGITYAPQIKKEEAQIDWSQDGASVERLVRAFTSWPGTFTFWNGKQVKIHAGENGEGKLEIGQITEIDGRIAIGTGDGLYFPLELQLEGKKRVDIESFINGYSDFVGSKLESL
jgi:methionyl-tRNA formyltransferase